MNPELMISKDSPAYPSLLKKAVNWQIDIQLSQLNETARFHTQHMHAQIVGQGHQNALKDIQLKQEALNRFKQDPNLMNEALRDSAVKAYVENENKQLENQRKNQMASEKANQEREAAIQQQMNALNTGGFKIQQTAGIPTRHYVRDVNY
jgi:hypothetical protein